MSKARPAEQTIRPRSHAESLAAIDAYETAAHAANDMVAEWVRRMGGWERLPDRFNLSSESWLKAEAELVEAGINGDAERTQELGVAYVLRVATFLHRWESEMNSKGAPTTTHNEGQNHDGELHDDKRDPERDSAPHRTAGSGERLAGATPK